MRTHLLKLTVAAAVILLVSMFLTARYAEGDDMGTGATVAQYKAEPAFSLEPLHDALLWHASVHVYDSAVYHQAEAITAWEAERQAKIAADREAAASGGSRSQDRSQRPSAPVGGSVSVPQAIANHFGTGALGQKATRVARCESQLRPGAVSPTNDHGLFQIHAGSAGFPGGWVSTFRTVTGTSFYNGVYNANLNAQFARWLYGQSGWGPWACGGA